MRYELKSIGVWSVIKISFFFHLIGGLIFGLMYGVITSFVLAVADQFPGILGSGLSPEDLSGGMLIVVFPLMFSFFGAIFGTLMSMVLAGLYNVIARLIGGLEFNFSANELAAPSQPGPYRPESATPPPAQSPITPLPPPGPVASEAAPTGDDAPTESPQEEPDSDITPDDSSDDERCPL